MNLVVEVVELRIKNLFVVEVDQTMNPELAVVDQIKILLFGLVVDLRIKILVEVAGLFDHRRDFLFELVADLQTKSLVLVVVVRIMILFAELAVVHRIKMSL